MKKQIEQVFRPVNPSPAGLITTADENGKPNRWKVENSWGDKSGQDGYYIMTDEWFGEYNYQVVVNRKYLSAEQNKMFDQEPIHLKPWDPMGSLA